MAGQEFDVSILDFEDFDNVFDNVPIEIAFPQEAPQNNYLKHTLNETLADNRDINEEFFKDISEPIPPKEDPFCNDLAQNQFFVPTLNESQISNGVQDCNATPLQSNIPVQEIQDENFGTISGEEYVESTNNNQIANCEEIISEVSVSLTNPAMLQENLNHPNIKFDLQNNSIDTPIEIQIEESQIKTKNKIYKKEDSGDDSLYHVKRDETIVLNVEPDTFEGELAIGLVHAHAPVQKEMIIKAPTKKSPAKYKQNSQEVEGKDCEKIAAFKVWNEYSIDMKAEYIELPIRQYGNVIVGIIKISPGEKFCIKFNTVSRDPINRGDKQDNRRWMLLAMPVMHIPSENITCRTDSKNCIGKIPLQVVAEIRKPKPTLNEATTQKFSEETIRVAELYEHADDSTKKAVIDLLQNALTKKRRLPSKPSNTKISKLCYGRTAL